MSSRIARAATIVVFSACAPLRTDVPTVPPDTDFDVAVGSIARLQDSDLLVRFDTVTEDGRCPQDVTCVWEGNATAVVTLDSAGKAMLARFTTSKPQPVRAFGWTFELRALRPPRASQTPPQPSDYVIALRASR
ncbi:MAG: hypothetical protein ACREOK_05060 [Gemmatimonadaceae bacterium]